MSSKKNNKVIEVEDTEEITEETKLIEKDKHHESLQRKSSSLESKGLNYLPKAEEAGIKEQQSESDDSHEKIQV